MNLDRKYLAVKSFVVRDSSGKGFTRVHDGEDFEYLNPEELYKKSYIEFVVSETLDLRYLKNAILPEGFTEELHVEAERDWNEMFAENMTVEIPEALHHLLISRSKKEQIKLLKDFVLRDDVWFAFRIVAWQTFGYTLSCYNFEGLPNGVGEDDLPLLIVDGEELKVVGETKLSAGQLRNVIAHRTVIVAFILDNGHIWHCFFCTYKSLRREESWKSGTPHWHYISDKWGISRADLVKSIKSGRHPSTPVHIASED